MQHFDKQLSLKVLNDLTSILNRYSIKYWLQDGTLLCYYRERDLISHDNDTDVGLFWKDIQDRQVFKDIISTGFNLFKIKGYMHNSLMLTFIKEKQKVDLFFYYENNDETIYHTALGKHWEIVKYNYSFFDLKEIVFKEYKFFVPKNEKIFLETKYGNDWNIPKIKWDNINGPQNAERTGTFVDINRCRKEFRTWLKK